VIRVEDQRNPEQELSELRIEIAVAVANRRELRGTEVAVQEEVRGLIAGADPTRFVTEETRLWHVRR
jgi:hypothetical protein